MISRKPLDITTLDLPGDLAGWIGRSPLYESSGESGARTVYIARDSGAYLKIAPSGALHRASVLQAYFARHGMTSPVLLYCSSDRDYLITQALPGEDGVSWHYLDAPERLSEVFGQSLRLLHELDASDCPVTDPMPALLALAQSTEFRQSHLDAIAEYIGEASADQAAAEIARTGGLLQSDALIHGDYCLPNIMLRDWEWTGFIDVADGGPGDRHYDLAWGLWTLGWNLKSSRYGHRFLDAYGRDRIDPERLRVCGLLAALE